MPFAARIALLCVLLPATLGAAAGGDFARLLDRMRAAAGPVWGAHVVSISRLSVESEQTVVSTDGSGVRFNLRRCTGELCQGTYFDGYHTYTVDINGTALPQSRDPELYIRSLRLIASLAFLAPEFATGGRRVDDGGYRTLSGKRYRMIFVVDPDAIPMEVFVDPQTALIRYARDVNGDDTFEYRDYRHVEGFTLPFEVLHNGNVLERYDDRTPVGSDFHPPHGPLPAFAGPPQAVATEPTSTTPVFTCELAGVPVRCLLDTGNSGLSVSSELASQLAAPVVGTFSVRGLGDYPTQVVRAGPLRIGNATFPPAYYVVLSDIRRYGYDVVVGADVLGTTQVQIDAADHSLLFGAVPVADSIHVPLSFQNFVPVVTVQLGTLDAQLAVDTGDESNINLAYEFYQKHPELFAITDKRTVGGVGATGVEFLGHIDRVSIGDYHLEGQVIGATETLHGTASGHLGAGFLGHFKVLLDYAAGVLMLTPQP